MLNSLESLLREEFGDEFRYEFAENAREALSIMDDISASGGEVAVIISDWLMPETKGDDLLIEAHEKYPAALGILLTGQADAQAIAKAKNEAGLYRCIAKPWNDRQLIYTIRSGLNL